MFSVLIQLFILFKSNNGVVEQIKLKCDARSAQKNAIEIPENGLEVDWRPGSEQDTEIEVWFIW